MTVKELGEYKNQGSLYLDTQKQFGIFRDKISDIAGKKAFPSLEFLGESDAGGVDEFYVRWLGKQYLIRLDYKVFEKGALKGLIYCFQFDHLKGEPLSSLPSVIELGEDGKAGKFIEGSRTSRTWKIMENDAAVRTLFTLLGSE